MRSILLLALLLVSPVAGQVPGEGASFGKVAVPFIDEHTLVVGRIDVSRMDVEAVLKVATTVLGDGEETGEMAAAVRNWVKEFLRLGGKDLCFTYGPGDFPNVPCLIAPIAAADDGGKALADHLSIPLQAFGTNVEWAYIHGCVCVGSREALAIVKARKPATRPDLVDAIEAGKDGVAQIAFALSADAKKIHEQVAPVLPDELGGGRIQTVTRGMKWMALVIGPGARMPAKWILEAVSPQAAQDLIGLEVAAQQSILIRLLKGESETDEAFRKRMKELISMRRTRHEGTRLTTEWELATTLLEAVKVPEGPPAERLRSANNLKQLMIALHNYHDVNGQFPTDSRTKDGKPLLSWRVHILPYIDHEHLYRQFKLDEPWDSPHNKKLVTQMPRVLRSPRQADDLKDRTTYLAPLGKGLMWDEPAGVKIFQITDGTSNTIALVEADDDRAVIWSKPEDISIDAKNPTSGLLGHYREGFQAAMADGSVRYFQKTIDAKTVWAMFTREGGEVIPNPK